MLIDVIKAGTVVTIKLVTGEEVLAQYQDETNEFINISKPMQISMNQQGIGLLPLLFSVDQESSIKIRQSSVISITPSHKDFANQYLSATTGIAING